jgi:hypothetical protein
MVRETKVTEPASTYPRPQKIIRRKDLPQYVGLHRSVIIEMIQAGTFPGYPFESFGETFRGTGLVGIDNSPMAAGARARSRGRDAPEE